MLGSFAEGKWAEITKGIDFNKLVTTTNKFLIVIISIQKYRPIRR